MKQQCTTFAEVDPQEIRWDEDEAAVMWLARVSPDEIWVRGHSLTYEQAHALYIDLVSATLAQVSQKRQSHPVSVSTIVQMRIDDDIIPRAQIPAIIGWLRRALQIEQV